MTITTCLLAVLLAPATSFAKTKKKIVRKTRKSLTSYLYNPRKTYGDEKIVIANPTSRCTTASMKALHASKLALAKKDGESVTLTGGVDTAFRTYMNGLDTLWNAMEEPYCGYGAFGLTAARSSYEKTADRLRAAFLKEAKKVNAVK
jgi:hypothetical protein